MNKLNLVLLALCLSGLVWSAGCGKKTPSQSDGLPDYLALRNEVIKRVQAGTLQPDAAGMASLPPELKSASNDGKVFVAKDASDGLLVLFNAADGTPAAIGLLYAEHPVERSTKLKVGRLQITVGVKNSEHWYGTQIGM